MNIALDVVSIYYGLMTYEDINTKANNEVSEEEIDLNTNNQVNEDGITIVDSSKLYDPSLDFTYGGTALGLGTLRFLGAESVISIITGKPLQNGKDYSDVFPYSYLTNGRLVLAIKTGLFNKFDYNYITIPSISKDENHVFFSGAYAFNNKYSYTSITNKGRAFVFEIKNGKISTLDALTEFKVKDNEIVNDVLYYWPCVYVTTNERMIRSNYYTSDKKFTFYDTHERKCKKNTTKSGFIQDTYKNSRNYFYELTDDNLLYFSELDPYPYNMPINKLGVKLDINENVFNGGGVTKYVLFTRHNVYIIDEKGMMFGDLYLVKEAFGVDLKLENDEIIYGISDEVLKNSLSVHIMTSLRVIYIKDYVVIKSYYEDHKLAIDNEYTLNRIMSFGGGYLIESVKEK
jgi:hypothetical protein